MLQGGGGALRQRLQGVERFLQVAGYVVELGVPGLSLGALEAHHKRVPRVGRAGQLAAVTALAGRGHGAPPISTASTASLTGSLCVMQGFE